MRGEWIFLQIVSLGINAITAMDRNFHTWDLKMVLVVTPKHQPLDQPQAIKQGDLASHVLYSSTAYLQEAPFTWTLICMTPPGCAA